MKLIISNTDPVENVETKTEINVGDENENILLFCAPYASSTMITFQRYYRFCSDIMFPNGFFPYIVKENLVYWNMPYAHVTIGDFIKTHKLTDGDTLYMESEYVLAGGPGWQDIEVIWNAVWPILKNMVFSIVTFTGFLASLATLQTWVKDNLFNRANKPPTPHQFFEFILSENSWNHHLLAKKLQISSEDAKLWLKALKYKWDSHTCTYTITETVKNEVLNLISSVDYLDL
jgi:hypothetical protein